MTVFRFDIVNIIGSPVAISPSKAKILYQHFQNQIEKREHTQYSFNGIEDFSSAFCNASIGKIYMDYGKRAGEYITFLGMDGDKEIWSEKVKRSIQLGIEENYRNSNQQTLEEILS